MDPVADLLARLRLDYKARKRGAIIIEGPTDERVLSSVVGVDPRSMFPVGGRNNVLRCAREIGENRMTGVICIADRDFDADETDFPDIWWLILYDDADLESMLFESAGLDRLLEEWASRTKLERFGGPQVVRSHAREQAGPLSRLRAENARKRIGLPFVHINVLDLTDKHTGGLKISSLVGRLTELGDTDRASIETALDAEPITCPHTGRPLAKGRDLLAILTALLRQKIGSLSKQQSKEDFCERSLRLASQTGDFGETPFQARFDSALGAARREALPGAK